MLAEAERRLAALSEADCEDMLREMLPDLERKEIARVIEDNFYGIRADIRQLIENECPDVTAGGPSGEILEESLEHEYNEGP